MKRETMERHGIPKESADMMAHFQDAFRLNDDEWAFVRQRGFNREYFFIESRGDREKGRGWCSHCRTWQTICGEPLGHKSEVTCPHCGYGLNVMHTWRMSKYLYDEALVYLYRPSVIDSAIVTARAVDIIRPWAGFKAPHLMREEVRVDSFYVFEPGRPGRMLRPKGGSQIFWAMNWPGQDRTRKVYTYEEARQPAPRDWAYQQTFMGWDRRNPIAVSDDTAGAFRAAAGSPLRYGMDEYKPWADDHFIRYWHWAARYSSVEKLVKIGLAGAVSEIINKRSEMGPVINWRGKTLTSILRERLTKADKAYLLEHGGTVDAYRLVIWQLFSGSLSVADTEARQYYSVWVWRRIKKHVNTERALRYLQRQEGKRPADRIDREPYDAGTYADYLDECSKLGYDMTDKAVLFPRDYRKEHEHTMRLIKYQENKVMEDSYAVRRRGAMKRKYSYEAQGMVVIVPERLADLIIEGKRQHNCVGGYMERVAKGKTDVVFVRRLSAPDESYITMEITDGQIVQARTKNNGPLDQAGKQFIDEFRAVRLEKKARKTA